MDGTVEFNAESFVWISLRSWLFFMLQRKAFELQKKNFSAFYLNGH